MQVRPYATTEEVCQLCAEKFKVHDPEDHALFLLTEESTQQLAPDTHPQKIKAELHSRPQIQPFYFVYRRIQNLNLTASADEINGTLVSVRDWSLCAWHFLSYLITARFFLTAPQSQLCCFGNVCIWRKRKMILGPEERRKEGCVWQMLHFQLFFGFFNLLGTGTWASHLRKLLLCCIQ